MKIVQAVFNQTIPVRAGAPRVNNVNFTEGPFAEVTATLDTKGILKLEYQGKTVFVSPSCWTYVAGIEEEKPAPKGK